MRNVARMLVWDIGAPLLTMAALLAIGVVLGWPLWWVSVCSMLCLLVVEGMIANFVLYRRDSVTVGTDDDAPRLRLAVVGLCTVALVAALGVGYARWTLVDQDFTRNSAEVARIADEVAVATATFTPLSPGASIDRALSFMGPDRADAFRGQFEKASADLAKRNITAQAEVISAGLEVLGPSTASVAVLLRGTQTAPGQKPSTAVLALRVALSKRDGRWLVEDVSPINTR